MPEQGDIVLIPVPFTDLSATRRRPVIVISNDQYQRATSDMVVVAMTSNLEQTPYGFTIDNSDMRQGSLNRPGKVRVDRILNLAQSLSVKVFGKVKDSVLERIDRELDALTKRPTP